MCEANAYLRREGGEELIMEAVDLVRPEPEGVFLVNIFGDQRLVDAEIEALELAAHRVVLRPRRCRDSSVGRARD